MPIVSSKLSFPAIIAHRGLSSEAPENTLAAISVAAERGMRWVEVDVKLTRDNVFILCHDATVDRTSNGKGKVADLNSDYISSLDAGSWFDTQFKHEKFPLLQQVLKYCKEHNVAINLELKPDAENISSFAGKLEPIISNYQRQGVQILVTCFKKTVVLDLFKINSKIPLGFLVESNDSETEIIDFCEKINCVSIHLPDKHCTKKSIKQIQQLNKKILVYTVNNVDRAEHLFALGVDSVFSNFNLLEK